MTTNGDQFKELFRADPKGPLTRVVLDDGWIEVDVSIGPDEIDLLMEFAEKVALRRRGGERRD